MDLSDSPSESLLEFKNILEATCSFTFEFDEGPNIITKEQSLVVKDIEKLVYEDGAVSTKIIEGLTEIFSIKEYLKKALLPSVLKKKGVTIVFEQESLVRILLKVNDLQDDVFKLLLDELVNVCSITEDCSELRLLLNPLKYLPNINNAKHFSQKLLDILEICTPEFQLEMLDVIPDIIPDSCYNTVAEQLLTILNEDNSPRDAIIECFGAFDFDDNVKDYMYGKLMNLIVPVHPQCLPATVKLLFNTHKGKIPAEIFLRIRDIINCEMKKKEDIPLKSDIVNALKSVSNKENFIQSCLEMVNSIKVPRDHIPFDIFILLMLGDNTKFKELIRKKIETGYFTENLAKNTITNVHYRDALISHNGTNMLIKLTSFLLKFTSAKIEHFVRSLFHALLGSNCEEERLQMLMRDIVECFIRACNNSDMKCVHQVLRILYRLIKKNQEKFHGNLNKLMGLLKKMDDFDLQAASSVYKIVCSFPHILGPENPQSEVIENEINMTVRKQLMSSRRVKKSKGIMGSIMLLQYDIISDRKRGDSEESMEEEISENTSIIIESVKVLTEGFPECTGMFYDELASTMEKNEIKRNFVDMMIKKVRLSLEDYISSPNEQIAMINNLAYSPKYGLSGTGKSVTLRIGLMAAEPNKYVNKPLILLPPLFRLYSSLVAKTVDDPMDCKDFKAFISSSIMLPSFDKLDDLSTDQLNQSADVLYHTINYLKEVVDATINDPIHENLFVDRFQVLTKLEGFFNDILARISEHTFPLPYFYDCSKAKQMHETKKKSKTNKAKKRKISHDDTTASTSILDVNELNTTACSVATSKRPSVRNRNSKYLIEHNIVCREINLYSLFNMIQYSIEINDKEKDEDVKIGYDLMVFILRDVVRELRANLLKRTGKNDINLKTTPERVLENISENLPKVSVSFNELVKEMESLEVLDENCEMIMCFSYFLELFDIILSVPLVGSTELIDKVHQALDVNTKKTESPDESRKKLCRSFSDHLKISVLLSHGVLIYQIIEKIMQYQQSNLRTLKLTLCESILWKQWSQSIALPYSDKQYNQDTKFMLEKYFKELKVQQLHELLSKVSLEYVDLKSKNDQLPSLPIIKYTNFHIFFVTFCSALHENVEKEVHVPCSNMDHLRLWKNTTSVMFLLMGIAKNVNCRHNILLCTFLKKSVPILKIFIAQALPIFDLMFSSKTEMVVDILKSMQASTRFIHHLCCQSKMFKNFSVISHVPGFRLVLEQLIYKVKALLVSHKCEEAFFLGNLKNKDIHGNTQTSEVLDEDTTQENEHGEDDEEMVDDDSDVIMEDDDRSESLTF